jgi:hypothetical protein
MLAGHELIDVLLHEEQLQRVEHFQQRIEAAFRSLIVQSFLGDVLLLHQQRHRQRDLTIGRRRFGRTRKNRSCQHHGRKAEGQTSEDGACGECVLHGLAS